MSAPHKKALFRGKIMPLASICELAGVNRRSLDDHIAHGRTADEAVERIIANRKKRTRHIQWGALTQTIGEWSKVTGIPVNIIRDRLKHGWTVEEALTIPPMRGPYSRPRRSRLQPTSADKLANGSYPPNGNALPPVSRKGRITLSLNGEALTLDEWAARIGISRAGLNERLRMSECWTLEQALTTPPGTRNRHSRRVKTAVIERPYKPVVRCIDGRPVVFYEPHEATHV